MMLSIIIPALNHHEMTRECIRAIRESTQDCEIILIDNGSTPPYESPYTGFIHVTLVRNPENVGFPAAVNQGIAVARGETIILLNNDCVVTPGWAEKLLRGLEQLDIVGPVTNDCAGLQRVMLPIYENEEQLRNVARERAEEYGEAFLPVRWVIGFCMAFRKILWEEIGPFDQSLWPCCGEEIDFCLRTEKSGYKTGIALGCFIHHEMSATFQAMGLDYDEIIERNNEHLSKKWGPDWTRQSLDAPMAPHGQSLNLGCGYRKLEGFLNIDNRPETDPDLCFDLTGIPWPFTDGSIDLIRADDFLEHIPADNVICVMEEIWRILKPGGAFESSTPSTDGRGAFQDPTHRSFWNRNSWLYYSDKASRELYGIKADFTIESITENEPDSATMIIHTHVVARARK